MGFLQYISGPEEKKESDEIRKSPPNNPPLPGGRHVMSLPQR